MTHLRAPLLALALAAPAASAQTLRARGTYATGLHVDACDAQHRCVEWARFPVRPFRSIVAVEPSPSGRYFFVWSAPDRGARDVDVFARPARDGAPATRVGHWTPGFGGALRWVRGDHLWHSWGCGTNCVSAQLYDPTGTTMLRLPAAAAEWASPDGRFVAVASHGGLVELVDLARALTNEAGPVAGARWPVDVTWSAHGARVRFEYGANEHRVVEAPAP